MITSRRDYLQRTVDEVTRLASLLVFKRRAGATEEALELAVRAFERLFDMDRDRIFQLTPDQQFAMLTRDEPPDVARDKALLYAAVSDQAGRTYTKMRKEPMAFATYSNALRFAVKARQFVTDAPLPDYAPKIDELVALVGPDRLDPDIAALLEQKS